MQRLCLVLALLASLTIPAAAQERLRVGVCVRSTGAQAVLKALVKDRELTVRSFKEVTAENLLACDAVFFGACTLDQPGQVKALKTFLACGGGAVLCHQACGRGRPETLLPAIVKRVIDRRPDAVLTVKDAQHPIANGLPPQFEHAYQDHLFLEPGPEGTVVVADREGAAVVVTGGVGAGRVVFNGSLPGYRYDPATYAQSEVEPAGGELRLTAAAVKWAGAARLTRLPAEELAARRKKAEMDLKLEDLSRLLPTSDWFGNEMLLGSYLPLPPVQELGGRFFITYDAMSWRGYRLKKVQNAADLEFYRNRLRLDICQLKWLGVTDIIQWTDVSGERVWRPTEVPDSEVQCLGIDPLAELIRAATPEGLTVWAAWHSCIRSAKAAQKYAAKDDKGQFYKYGGDDYCEDLLSPAYRQRCHQLLDEYAAKYKPLGNFKGLAMYDELWFSGVDFHGDDLAALAQFCEKRFGEKPPSDIAKRLALRGKWLDPDDVWRRRYILFKQHVMTDFCRDLVEHAHRRGIQLGLQLLDAAQYPAGWAWGMDSVALARQGADLYVGGGQTAAGAYDNQLRWSHVHGSWGLYNTLCFRGGPGGIFFTFNQLWRLIMFGNNPALPRELARHIHQQRQWAGAESLARVALLHNQNALQMLLADTRPTVNREASLIKRLETTQDIDVIFTQATELYDRFSLLVAMPYSVRGLSQEVYGRLRRFAEEGGTILSIGADWSLAREDLTAQRPMTSEMLGVTYADDPARGSAGFRIGEAAIELRSDTPRRRAVVSPGAEVLAAFGDGTPAVTRRALGKGQVIALHFAAEIELDKGDNPALSAWLGRLVQESSRAAITASGEGFRLISALKKGNWVGVALYPDRVPCEARLQVDLEALGIRKTQFRMLMLGKRMEIGRPGDLWGERAFWSPAELKKGFRVTIPADDDRNRPLPEAFDLAAFQNKRDKPHGDYLDHLTRDWWDNEGRGKAKRTYAYEIVVLAPADEPALK